MSITARYGPEGRSPDYGTFEYKDVHMSGAGTEEIAAFGSGIVHTIVLGVAGGAGALLKLYDAPATGTLDATTEIVVVDLSTLVNGIIHRIDAAFANGLTAVVTGATSEFTLSGRWRRPPTRRVVRREPA